MVYSDIGDLRLQDDEDGTHSIIDVSTGNVLIDMDELGAVTIPSGTIDASSIELGRGLEDDGTGAIQFDEDTSYTFTSNIEVSTNITTGSLTLSTDNIKFDHDDPELLTSGSGSANIEIFDVANSQSITQFNEGGDVEIPSGSLNFSNSNSIQDSGVDAITFDGSQNVTIPNGEFDVNADTNITGDINLQGVNISANGADLTFKLGVDSDTNDFYQFLNENSVNLLTINENGSIQIPNGPLNFNNSDSIQDAGIDAIQFDGSQNVTISNGDLSISNGSYQGYEFQTGSTTETWVKVGELSGPGSSAVIHVTGDENYGAGGDTSHTWATISTGNDVNEIGGKYYSIGSGGVKNVGYVDTSGGGIPNAEIYVKLGSFARGHILVNGAFNMDVSYSETTSEPAGYTTFEESMTLKSKLEMSGADIDLSSSNSIQDAGVDAIQFDGSQNVTIPNGLINVTGGDVNINGGLLDIDVTAPSDIAQIANTDTPGSGDMTFRYDNANLRFWGYDGNVSSGNAALTLNYDDHNVIIPNGSLNFSGSNSIQDAGTDAIQFDGNQNITIPNGSINMNSNNIDSVSNINGVSGSPSIRTAGGGSDSWSINDVANSQQIIQFNEGGNVDILNGDLTVTGSSQSIQFGDGAGNGSIGAGSVKVNFFTGDSTVGLEIEQSTYDVGIPNGDLVGSVNDSSAALELDEQTSVADTGKVQISRDTKPQGYAMIQDTTNNVSAMVYLGGATNSVEVLHDSGAGDNFTTTEGNDGTTNIYYDSGNARYELNNETGGAVTYAVEVLKA